MSHYLDCVREGVFCGLCYSGLRGRKTYRGHYGYRAPRAKRKVQWWMIARNKAQDGQPSKGVAEKSGGDWEKAYPALCEFLCKSSWEDGESRTTGTVMLMTEAGLWKAWVNDRDAGLSAFVSSGTLPGLLKSLDKGVESGQLDWRVPKNGTSGGKGKR